MDQIKHGWLDQNWTNDMIRINLKAAHFKTALDKNLT